MLCQLIFNSQNNCYALRTQTLSNSASSIKLNQYFNLLGLVRENKTMVKKFYLAERQNINIFHNNYTAAHQWYQKLSSYTQTSNMFKCNQNLLVSVSNSRTG